jgi:hypothetical protein
MSSKVELNKEREEKMNVGDFLKIYNDTLNNGGYKKWIKVIEKQDINAIPEWEKNTLLAELLKNLWESNFEIILDLLSVEWLKISWLQELKSFTQKGKNWKPNGSESNNFIELTQILQQKIGEEEKNNKDTSLENTQKSVDELIREIENWIQWLQGNIAENFWKIKDKTILIKGNFNNFNVCHGSKGAIAIFIKQIIEEIDSNKSENIELLEKLQELQKRFEVSEFDKQIKKHIAERNKIPDLDKKTDGDFLKYYQTLQKALQEIDEIAIIEAKKNLGDLIKSISDDNFSEALDIHSLCKPAKKVKQELLKSLEKVYEPNSRTKSLYSIAELIVNSDCLADPAWKVLASSIWGESKKPIKIRIKENYKAFQVALQKWDKEGTKKIIEKLTELINTAKDLLAGNGWKKLQENMPFSIPSEMSWIVTITEPEEMVELRKIKKLQQQFDWEKALFLNPNLDETTLRKIRENIETSRNPLMKAIFENIFLEGENNLEELMVNSTKKEISSIQQMIMWIFCPEYY